MTVISITINNQSIINDIEEFRLMQSFRNNWITRYESTLSLIFFFLSICTLFFFTMRLRRTTEKGAIQHQIQTALIGLVIFNFPYKFSLTTNEFTAFYDTFVNCAMTSFMFFLNLVIVHGLSC